MNKLELAAETARQLSILVKHDDEICPDWQDLDNSVAAYAGYEYGELSFPAQLATDIYVKWIWGRECGYKDHLIRFWPRFNKALALHQQSRHQI